MHPSRILAAKVGTAVQMVGPRRPGQLGLVYWRCRPDSRIVWVLCQDNAIEPYSLDELNILD